MKTSAPRTDSPKRARISPFGKSTSSHGPTSIPRCPAMSEASSGCERPEYKRSLCFETSSTWDLPFSTVRAERRPHDRTWSYYRPGRQPRPRAYSRVLAYCHLFSRSRPHLCPRSNNAVHQMRARAYLRACGHLRVPLKDRPGEKCHVFCQLDRRVQVSVLWVDHRYTHAH